MRIIYLHNGVEPLKKGALTDITSVYKTLSKEQRKNILDLYFVGPSLFVSLRHTFFRFVLSFGEEWKVELKKV